MKKIKVLLVILDFQDNHQAFYSMLINKVFADADIDILQCKINETPIEEKERIRVHCIKEDEGLKSFLNSKKAFFKQADLIIIEELYTFHLSVLLQIIVYGHKSLQIVHNTNKFLRRNIKFNIKSVVAYIFFKIVKHYVKGIIVISQTVKEYIVENKLFNNNVYYIPFNDTSVEYTPKIDVNAPVKFTIAGTVNTERRNYKIFLKVFLRILQENPNSKLKLCLLGKIVKIENEELRLINEIKEINLEAISLWDTFIDNQTYHDELLTTQFLIGNINIEYTENNVKEIYGQSKETGVLFLMLQYKIPTLFPEEYGYSKIYENQIITYKNEEEELYNSIIGLLNDPKGFLNTDLRNHNLYVRKETHKIHKKFLSAKN